MKQRTVGYWLGNATAQLQASDIASARLDTLVMLEDATGKDRGWLLAHPEYVISKQQVDTLDHQLARRAMHEPLAYIRGKSEFYGRTLMVSPATLQPRPETETMITLFKSLKLEDGSAVADVGTGSGAVAITLKLEQPSLIVHATEIQADALAVAQKNAQILEADITFHNGGLLEPLIHTEIDAVLANLPYVPNGHTINQAAMQEPSIAIFGGETGLELYEKMFKQIKELGPRYVLTESLPFQHRELLKIAESYGYSLKTSEDFIQVFES